MNRNNIFYRRSSLEYTPAWNFEQLDKMKKTGRKDFSRTINVRHAKVPTFA